MPVTTVFEPVNRASDHSVSQSFRVFFSWRK